VELDTELLRQVPIFGGLRLETLAFLLDRSATIAFQEKEWLFREGESGCDLFILDKGKVEVIKTCGDHPVHLAYLEAGDCVGEMALLAVTPRSASVQAVTYCRAVRVTNGDLAALYARDVEQFAIVMMNLGREVARRLWVTNELLYDSRSG